jgi:hypothetical protein
MRPGQLAHHVVQPAEVTDRRRPYRAGAATAGLRRRVAEMVEDESQLRCATRGHDRQRQLMPEQGEVEAQARCREFPQPVLDGGPGQPLRVRLGEQRVPDAGQPVPARKLAVGGDLAGDVRRGQVRPADDRLHEAVRARGRQQVRGLGRVGEHLDHDCPADTLGNGGRFEVSHREGPAQRSQLFLGRPWLIAGEPWLLTHGQVPQVVVGVDHGSHGTPRPRCRGTAAPAGVLNLMIL